MSFDIENWPRREIYEFFGSMSQPFYSVTFRVDVTKVHSFAKAQGISFYYALIWLVTRAVNLVPEFMLTIRRGAVEQLERRDPSFTDMKKGSECFHIVTLPMQDNIVDFCREAKRRSEEQTRFINAESESDALIFISCLPWVDITALTNERDFDCEDSVPRISWGKYTEENGRLMLGMSVEVNHRIIDGVHIGQFAAALEAGIDSLE